MGGGLFLVLIILAFAGRGLLRASLKTAAYERTAYAWVVGLSVVAGVVLFFVITLVSHQDPEVAAWAAILSGLGIALVLAFLVPV
ncbi:MAG: hypothetical protein WA446_21265, partial [Steroidobacteraceae bacterium]